MSRTIRKHKLQYSDTSKTNNIFYGIKKYEYSWCHIDNLIDRNIHNHEMLLKGISECHRDGYIWSNDDIWKKFIKPVPRNNNKREIKRVLTYNSEYNWNETGARKIQKSVASYWW